MRQGTRRTTVKNTTLSSRCGDEIERGTKQQLVTKYEALGYQAQRDKDPVLAQTYFQHAEHYKKEDS